MLMLLITFHLSLIYKIIKFLAPVTILDSCYKSATAQFVQWLEYRLEDQGIMVWFLAGARVVLSPTAMDQFWGLANPIFSG